MASDDSSRRRPRWGRWLVIVLGVALAALARERSFRANRERFGPPGPPPITD